MSAPDLHGNDLKSKKLKKLSRHRNHHVRQAYQYFASNRWLLALNKFEAALGEYPSDGGLYHRKGDCFYNLGLYQEAQGAYEQAIRLKFGRRKTKRSLEVCLDKKANTLEKIRQEAIVRAQRTKSQVSSPLNAQNTGQQRLAIGATPSTHRPVQAIPPSPMPRPTIDPYAAARAAQEHSRKLESWPQGLNGIPMPRPPMTGVYPAGRPQYPNGIPIIGYPQHINGTPIIPPRFGMKIGG